MYMERRQAFALHQLGAPALIHAEREFNLDSAPAISWPFPPFPESRAGPICELWDQERRVKSRWNYSIDIHQIQDVKVPTRVLHWTAKAQNGKKRKESVATKVAGEVDTDGRRKERKSKELEGKRCPREDPEENISVQKDRFTFLLDMDPWDVEKHRQLLQHYSKYDRPHVPGSLSQCVDKGSRSSKHQLKFGANDLFASQTFSLDHRASGDPAYLAPFPRGGLEACAEPYSDTFRTRAVDRSKTVGRVPRSQPQGNCLLCFACPCPPCGNGSSDYRSWCLIQPRGPSRDRLFVSNLIPPCGGSNAGHIYNVERWAHDPKSLQKINAAMRLFPNEAALGDTVLDVVQGGSWQNDEEGNPQCTFMARTGTHISVVKITAKRPILTGKACSYDEDVCWGNYHIRETQRIDKRSLCRRRPSYLPVSLASHPKYGNDFTNSKFAFAARSNKGERNLLYHCIARDERGGGGSGECELHRIVDLKSISLVEFSDAHPLCLWSAAKSYVSPAMAPDADDVSALGFGHSLFSIDLRSNASTFQWSPSAEDMLTEGVHSLSGILTDWQRHHTIWVTCKSAGKTWELDSRMPCKVVNTWSLTSTCEESNATFHQSGFFGEGSLLVKTQQIAKQPPEDDGTPILNADTTAGAHGFHIYQRPGRRPRFQAESLECVASPGFEVFDDTASLSTSAVFPFPEMSEEIHICGLASIRMPLSDFTKDGSTFFAGTSTEGENVLCVLSLTNRGDLFCHSILEATDVSTGRRAAAGLPVGATALAIPNELDGETKELEHQSMKPAGGMNIRLFLTNLYPTPKSQLPISHVSKRKFRSRIGLPRKVKKRKRRGTVKPWQHPSLKLDRNAPTYTMVPTITSDISIMQNNVENSEAPYNVANSGWHLRIPQSLVNRRHQKIVVGGRTGSQPIELGTERRSDITLGVMQRAKDFWDDLDGHTKKQSS